MPMAVCPIRKDLQPTISVDETDWAKKAIQITLNGHIDITTKNVEVIQEKENYVSHAKQEGS